MFPMGNNPFLPDQPSQSNQIKSNMKQTITVKLLQAALI
jgi:hypothetical protein